MTYRSFWMTRRRILPSLGLLLLVVLPPACGGGGGGGGGAHDFSSLTLTTAVAVGDLNGDGLADCATTSAYGYDFNGFVSVFLQDPSRPGSFLPASRYAVGSDPWFIALGDLNGDGLPDLVTANERQGTLSLLFQHPGTPGSFLSAQTLTTASHPNAVAIGRLNSDAALDLAVADLGLSLFLQDLETPGIFLPRTTLGLGSTGSVAIGDLNGDGVSDLAVIGGGMVRVLLQDPQTPGTYRSPMVLTAGLQPSTVTIVDLNVDGAPDLVVANFASNTISVFLQDSATPVAFLSATTLPAARGPLSIAVADLNGDGKPDLVVACEGSATEGVVSVLLQDPSHPGQFLAATNYRVGSQASSVGIGDLNGDGRLDLAVAISDGLAILLQDSSRPGAFLFPKILGISH